MNCFPFTNRDKKDELHTPRTAVSNPSSYSIFTENEAGRNGSQLNSQNVSATSMESTASPSFSSTSQRPSDLRVFIIAELKSVTKNFRHSVMTEEGVFDGVFKGLIKNSEYPSQKVEIAVKKNTWWKRNTGKASLQL